MRKWPLNDLSAVFPYSIWLTVFGAYNVLRSSWSPELSIESPIHPKKVISAWKRPSKYNYRLNFTLTPCLPVTSADNFGKQFGPRSGPTNRRAWSGSKLFDILMVFLKLIWKKSADDKKAHKNFPVCNELIQCIMPQGTVTGCRTTNKL